MSADERAALVKELREWHQYDTGGLPKDAADLIEADGKRLALAEKTIADAKAAADDAGMVNWEENNYAAGAQMVAAVLSDYDAAKEALS